MVICVQPIILVSRIFTRSIFYFCFTLALLGFGLSPSLVADQNDPELDNLFIQLLAAKDQATGDEITDQIWGIWRAHADPEISEMMDSGIRLMTAGRLRQAERVFTDIIEQDPGYAEGWNKRATVRYFLGQHSLSAADIHRCLILEDRHFGAISGLGLIYFSQDNLKRAKEAFQKAIDINPHLTGPRMQIKRLEEILMDDPV